MEAVVLVIWPFVLQIGVKDTDGIPLVEQRPQFTDQLPNGCLIHSASMAVAVSGGSGPATGRRGRSRR